MVEAIELIMEDTERGKVYRISPTETVQLAMAQRLLRMRKSSRSSADSTLALWE